jgi:hypothetical protein
MERIYESPMRGAVRQRWRSGGEWDQAAAKVIVGERPDGRWYARIYAGSGRWPDRGGACAYSGANAEWLARATAARWMRTIGGTWVEA